MIKHCEKHFFKMIKEGHLHQIFYFGRRGRVAISCNDILHFGDCNNKMGMHRILNKNPETAISMHVYSPPYLLDMLMPSYNTLDKTEVFNKLQPQVLL